MTREIQCLEKNRERFSVDLYATTTLRGYFVTFFNCLNFQTRVLPIETNKYRRRPFTAKTLNAFNFSPNHPPVYGPNGTWTSLLLPRYVGRTRVNPSLSSRASQNVTPWPCRTGRSTTVCGRRPLESYLHLTAPFVRRLKRPISYPQSTAIVRAAVWHCTIQSGLSVPVYNRWGRLSGYNPFRGVSLRLRQRPPLFCFYRRPQCVR